MIKDILISVIQFIVLVLLQVFVLDNISFWGFATPMIYVWFIMLLPYDTAKWIVLLSSFVLGMSIDVFSGQTGIHAFACTFVGFVRPVLLNTFSGNIDTSNVRFTMARIGFANFIFFTLTTVFIHHLLCFLLGVFSFAEIGQTLLRCVLSTLLSSFMIVVADTIFFKKTE
ncbi:MAG: rod shape-determining protein MreD [Bacteroidota bacterium]|nr:rod shape-determining protein MreD [Bacteroidota bacterium]